MNDVVGQQELTSLKYRFNQDGFVILRDFLSAKELADLKSRTDQYLQSIDYEIASESANDKAFGGTRKNLHKVVPWFDGQLRSGKPFQTVRTLLDSELEPATAAYFERIPGEERGIAPHFDALGDRRFGATIWIALDQAKTNNGCLYYAKGSHHAHYPSKVGIEGFNNSRKDAIAIELDPGDAAIHSSLTVHWSNANRSQSRRRGISYFYWCDSRVGASL